MNGCGTSMDFVPCRRCTYFLCLWVWLLKYSTIQDPPTGPTHTHTHTQNRPKGNVHEERPSRTTLQELSGRLA